MKIRKNATEKYYEHPLIETCCDLCGKKTDTPVYFKFEGTWHLWFFCTKEHQYAFGKRGPDGYSTLQ